MRTAGSDLANRHDLRSFRWILMTLSCAAALAGCAGHAPPLRSSSAQSAKTPHAPEAADAEKQAANPVGIRISTAHVGAGIDPLQLDRNGALSPPHSTERAGWWVGGPEPGERGPAVIAGHVDSSSGPAVFFELNKLSAGDEIRVDRADGSTVRFSVDRQENYTKADFPTHSIYGHAPDSQLRLITCGGSFDDSVGRYLENTVIYAHRV